MNDITLISVDDIREITSISKNIVPELLEPYINIAEQWYVHEIVGTALITELKNQITGNTITALNARLLQLYIRPLCAYGAWLEASEFLDKKTTGKGIVKQSSDNSENVSEEGLIKYQTKLKTFVENYQSALREFLEANKSTYPLYRSTATNDNFNSTGIYLGNYN